MKKFCYLFSLLLICSFFSCSNEDEQELKPQYSKGDTLVYIPFNQSFQDKSKYNNPVVEYGTLNYLSGIKKQPLSAGFFNHSACLQLEFNARDSMEISFWFAPFRLSMDAPIIDCLDHLFSVYVSDVSTEYVDAYSAATYTLSVGSRNGNDLNTDLQAKPYPLDTAFFDENAVWHQVQLITGANSEPVLILNSYKIGEINTGIHPVANMDRINVTIGAEENGENYFCGKIDEFIIRKLN